MITVVATVDYFYNCLSTSIGEALTLDTFPGVSVSRGQFFNESVLPLYFVFVASCLQLGDRLLLFAYSRSQTADIFSLSVLNTQSSVVVGAHS